MIATQPIASTAEIPTVLGKVDSFIASAKVAAADGLTWSEFGELLVSFLRMAVSLYDDVVGMTGEEKKAAVLDGVASLFDAVADRCVPLVAWPIWGLARGPVRLLVLALASGAVEQVLPLVRSVKP